MILFDSMVVIYALRDNPPRAHERYREIAYKIESSRDAIARADQVAISAVSYVEIGRGIIGKAADKFGELYHKFNVIQLDGRAAFRALEIMNHRRTRQAICKECLGATESVKCPTCGNRRSAHQRIADILIVATADTHPEIDTLYTYDSGIMDLSNYVSGCKIQEPPGMYGNGPMARIFHDSQSGKPKAPAEREPSESTATIDPEKRS